MHSIFDTLTLSSDMPIFLQVVAHIKRKIVAGALQDGDELPSRRKLAVLLGINPNTVQKIYQQLEDEGLLTSSQGAKSVLCITSETESTLQTQLVEQTLEQTLNTLKESGMSLAQILEMTVRFWGEDVVDVKDTIDNTDTVNTADTADSKHIAADTDIIDCTKTTPQKVQ